MKILAALGLASAMALVAVTPANAAQGCGPGMHRAPSGICRPDHAMGATTWVVGRYYPGHGYWYHNRWWHHRDHDQDNGWRYR